MIESKAYQITEWTKWDAEFIEAIAEFVVTHKTKPNYLAASAHTHEQIEFVINLIPGSHKNVQAIGADGSRETLSADDYLELGGFETKEVVVDFVINNQLTSGQFYLLKLDDNYFDNDDDDANDPTPVPETDPVLCGVLG